VKRKVSVEYRPGFLSLREGPILLAAARKLRVAPEAYLVDGHGRAHPRRFGLACHVGLALVKPTVGVAKSVLIGKVIESTLVDDKGTVTARILRDQAKRSYYVSVGHLISLDDAFRLVQLCLSGSDISPLSAAHVEAARLIRGFKVE